MLKLYQRKTCFSKALCCRPLRKGGDFKYSTVSLVTNLFITDAESWLSGKSHLGDYYWTVFAHIAETPHTTHEGLLKKKKKTLVWVHILLSKV